MAKAKTRKRVAAEPSRPATLRWLKIHKFRHVEPCELHFSDTYNVLLGLNGTGKTTLLEVIAAALSFNFAKMKKEAFFVEYEVGYLDGTVRASVCNEEVPHARPVGGLPRSGPTYQLSADLVISKDLVGRKVSAHVDAKGVRLQVGSKSVESQFLRADDLKRNLFLVRVLSEAGHACSDAARPLTVLPLYWDELRRFDEALGFLRFITGASTDIQLHKRSGNVEWTLAMASGLVPEPILREIERQSKGWGSSMEPVVTIAQEHIKFLSQVAEMLAFKKVEIRLTHTKTQVQGDGSETSYFGELKFMLERDDGSVIPHTLLSYGQKRALAFLYYLAVNERAVIADELVDGLHHSWIVDAIAAIGDRQAFLASQNPLLLDYLEFDSAAKVRASFVQCRLEKSKKGERMIWSNMSEKDAERVFDAYQVGLQHVSEILRTKGLW